MGNARLRQSAKRASCEVAFYSGIQTPKKLKPHWLNCGLVPERVFLVAPVVDGAVIPRSTGRRKAACPMPAAGGSPGPQGAGPFSPGGPVEVAALAIPMTMGSGPPGPTGPPRSMGSGTLPGPPGPWSPGPPGPPGPWSPGPPGPARSGVPRDLRDRPVRGVLVHRNPPGHGNCRAAARRGCHQGLPPRRACGCRRVRWPVQERRWPHRYPHPTRLPQERRAMLTPAISCFRFHGPSPVYFGYSAEVAPTYPNAR